jgi:hypothetical protein
VPFGAVAALSLSVDHDDPNRFHTYFFLCSDQVRAVPGFHCSDASPCLHTAHNKPNTFSSKPYVCGHSMMSILGADKKASSHLIFILSLSSPSI